MHRMSQCFMQSAQCVNHTFLIQYMNTSTPLSRFLNSQQCQGYLLSVVCDRRVLKSPGTSMVSGVYGLWGELTWVNGFMIMIAKVPWVIPDNNLRFLVQSQPVSKKR